MWRGSQESGKLVEKKTEKQEVNGEEEGRAGSWWTGKEKSRKLVEMEREERKTEKQEAGGSKMGRAGGCREQKEMNISVMNSRRKEISNREKYRVLNVWEVEQEEQETGNGRVWDELESLNTGVAGGIFPEHENFKQQPSLSCLQHGRFVV